ncbi:NfeD family protein [Tumidithrix helvetica PCC 7403]|uniref:NfeD family protein n=1 Tax=Tumidithrix helvetica TaxID=3457545 RepID=UPI003C8296DB
MNLTPSQIWLVISVVLLLVELLVPIPTFLIAGAMGLAALFVAAIAFVIPSIEIQIGLWILASAGLIWYSRRFIPKDSHQLKDATEGITLTAIPAGESGRVQYEGNSWKARCEDPDLTIPAQQKVVIVRRQGTTLIVVPEYWLHGD